MTPLSVHTRSDTLDAAHGANALGAACGDTFGAAHSANALSGTCGDTTYSIAHDHTLGSAHVYIHGPAHYDTLEGTIARRIVSLYYGCNCSYN